MRKTFISIFVLLLLAVSGPASTLRNANFEYYIHNYEAVEVFGFYADKDGASQITEEPFELDPSLGQTEPQFYFILSSNIANRSYQLSVKATPLRNNSDNEEKINYTLTIFDDDFDQKVKLDLSNDESTVNFKEPFPIVLTSGAPTKWAYGIYYIFDSEDIQNASSGEYKASITIIVDSQP